MKPEIPQAVCPNTTTRRLVIGCAEASGKTKTKQTLQDRNKAKNQHRTERKKEEERWQEARKENPKYRYDVSSRGTVSSVTNFY